MKEISLAAELKKILNHRNLVLLVRNQTVILRGLLSCRNHIQVEASISFAYYLNFVGINNSNYTLFLKYLETNNRWVIDALLNKRNPRLLFSGINPTRGLVRKAFKLLAYWHPSQIYLKVLQALLGLIEKVYHNADDGYNIYHIKLMDLNNLGKFLDESTDQDQSLNRYILDVLDRFTKLGENRKNIVKSNLSKQAFNIRIAFFDQTKKLYDVIPKVLLVKIKRESSEISPSEEFKKFLQNRKEEINL